MQVEFIQLLTYQCMETFNRFENFVPPPDTTIVRLMTKAERKHAGRKLYADYVASQIRKAYGDGITQIRVKRHTMMTILPSGKDVKVEYDAWYKSADLFPYEDCKCEYQLSIERWLYSTDPCFNAKILKNIQKQIRDRKSKANNR